MISKECEWRGGACLHPPPPTPPKPSRSSGGNPKFHIFTGSTSSCASSACVRCEWGRRACTGARGPCTFPTTARLLVSLGPCLGWCRHLVSLLLLLTLTLGVADFFIDQYLVEARAATLSRLMVAAVFPVRLSAQPSDRGTWHINNNHHSATLLQVVMLSSIAQRSVILFQRGGRRVQQREVR